MGTLHETQFQLLDTWLAVIGVTQLFTLVPLYLSDSAGPLMPGLLAAWAAAASIGTPPAQRSCRRHLALHDCSCLKGTSGRMIASFVCEGNYLQLGPNSEDGIKRLDIDIVSCCARACA